MTNGESVLVIDDEVGYRDFYKYLLEPLGYRVETAEDGEKGLEMALKGNYDLILLDIHMPKMSGFEVLKRVKEERPEQAVIVFSSNSDPSREFEKRIEQIGSIDCLFKPVDLEEIMKVINKALPK